MKRLITNYTFNAAARTVTFAQYGTIELHRILLVTNTTDNIIIYNFADTTKGGTVATNVLTLEYDTTGMDNSDALQIYYDAPEDICIISEGATYNYYSFAAPGTATSDARWQIERETVATGVFQKADGNDKYDNIHDNRASLSYS